MDFTLKKYEQLLVMLVSKGYSFQTFKNFLTNPESKSIILRHDVDLLPENSLRFAKIQHKLGIKGTYYFRAVSKSWDEDIILEIAKLGNEVGYHYETMDTANGDIKIAIELFEKNLNKLRELVDVKTICMHGSPLSKFDNKKIWKFYDYQNLNLIGEPYYDIDFNKVFYLTDTGRRWDGANVSVRDKVNTNFKQSYNSTQQIIEALGQNKLPDQIMFTFHPQRWHNNRILWINELVLQKIKNIVKKYLYVK